MQRIYWQKVVISSLNNSIPNQPRIHNVLSSFNVKYDTLIKSCQRNQETAVQPVGYKSPKYLLEQTFS